jgi:hypothetical protein
MCFEVLAWLGLTFGEFFVVVFLACFIVSAGYWPRLGAYIAEQIVSRKQASPPNHAEK